MSPSTAHYLRTIARQEQQIKRLVNERDELAETVRQLREKEQREIDAFPVPSCFNLTAKETAMFAMLLKYRVISKENFLGLLYDDPDKAPAIKIIDVFVCKIRAKLAPYGVEIETVWGQGYRMARTEKAKVRKLIEAEDADDEPVIVGREERAEATL